MIYHFYKADCFRASRVLMQNRWEEASILIHKSNNDTYEINKPFGVRHLLKTTINSKRGDVMICHAQSALPYLILGAVVKLMTRRKIKFVYDIHDLHEKEVNSASLSKTHIRYIVLSFLETLAFKIKSIKKITVSHGLAKTMASKYHSEQPVVVKNISTQPAATTISLSNRLNDVIVFFGTRERVPLDIIAALSKAGIGLHLYGKDITQDWLVSKIGGGQIEHVKFFGEYDPDDLGFLCKYKALIIYSPDDNSLNFRYSLPNKLFQALSNGLVVVVSKNFEEMTGTFSNSASIITVDKGNFIYGIKRAIADRPQKDADMVLDQIITAHEENRINYLCAIGLSQYN